MTSDKVKVSPNPSPGSSVQLPMPLSLLRFAKTPSKSNREHIVPHHTEGASSQASTSMFLAILGQRRFTASRGWIMGGEQGCR